MTKSKLFYGKVHKMGKYANMLENQNKYQLTVYEENTTPEWFKEGILQFS